MAKDSSPNTEEPEFLDESKEGEKAKPSSSSPDDEKREEEYLEDDTNDFEEVDVEGEDLDEPYEVVEEEYEEDRAEGPGGEDESASDKGEPESEGESPKEQKKKWKSLLSSSSDEEEEDSDDSDDYEWDEDDEDSEEGPLAKKPFTEMSAEEKGRLLIEGIEAEAKLPREERAMPTVKDEEEYWLNKKDPFNFPVDPEGWREEDLREVWEDAPTEVLDPGWDPVFADEDDREIMKKIREEGGYPPVAPFYLPYRRPYPVIPDNHRDIYSPKSVIEELDRIEEFLKWVSYIFPDGSSYEGTVWDDLAHGKGVYITENGLVRYEGEWLQNHMSGHGVVEVDIPAIEPVPGSKFEAKMRAEGKIISRDYMSPRDRRWLEMDIEDSLKFLPPDDEKQHFPFYENKEWVRLFGRKPEKGRYKYSGQWKHGRMHGCGVYEVNERVTFGRFYFGTLLKESEECDAGNSTLHAGIAEVAAAKARMFMNKPDGMVREERGPYIDPEHPYMYEEGDAWMAPGFVNQFYEVPKLWKKYVHEVDQEREMWLNSFYKSPLRIPMPAELEYWWSTDKPPEYVLINKEPEPDPEDPSKLIYTEDPLILHTPTGQLINYVEDEEHGIRLFWQPPPGEEVDPEQVEFLPLGYGESSDRLESQSKLERFIKGVDRSCRSFFSRLEKWTEVKRKESELNLRLLDEEKAYVEDQIRRDMLQRHLEKALKKKQKEEEEKALMDEKVEDDLSAASVQEEKVEVEEEEEEEEDEESPTSFGSVLEEDVVKGPNSTKEDKNGSTNGKSSFASISIPFASFSLTSAVPSMLQESFSSWRQERPAVSKIPADSGIQGHICLLEELQSVHFPRLLGPHTVLRAVTARPRVHRKFHRKNGGFLQLRSLARILLGPAVFKGLETGQSAPKSSSHLNLHEILSMQVPLYSSDSYTANLT